MVPNIIHTVFGMREDFGGKPFSLIHYLSAKSAYLANDRPEIRLYYTFEPSGYWWDKVQQYVDPVQIDARESIFGTNLYHPAHRTDVLKLLVLQAEGGIAMDLDVLCLTPFRKVLGSGLTIAREERDGPALCNAIMSSEAGSEFVKRWIEGHDPSQSLWKGFRSTGWDAHWGEMSTEYPAHLAELYGDLVTVLPYHVFFPYGWKEEEIVDLFAPHQTADLRRMVRGRTSGSCCVHLWEMVSWDRYLRDLTIAEIRTVDTAFHILARPFVEDEDTLFKGE